jgi:hypothetical protein
VLIQIKETLPLRKAMFSFSGPKAQALIRVRLAKMKLYEAKVGIVDALKKWDKYAEGKVFFSLWLICL